MEISRDALMRVVIAARVSLRLAEDMKELLIDNGPPTWADEISWKLSEALGLMCGEVVNTEDDLGDDSETMKLLTSPQLSDGEVTNWFICLYRTKHPEQPKPRFIDQEEMRKQAEVGCGYMTPEGDWK